LSPKSRRDRFDAVATPDQSQGGTTPLGLLALGGAVAMWGFSNVLIKLAAGPPLVKSLYRLWFAVPFLWTLALGTPSIRRSLDRGWLRASLVGGLLFALHQVCFFVGLQETSVANLTVIAALQPALVVFLAAYFFAEPVAWKALPFLVSAFVGVAFVINGATPPPGGTGRGDLVALANLFAFTAYFLVSKRLRASVSAAAYTIGMSTVAALAMTAIVLARDGGVAPIAPRDALILLCVALLPGTIGHMLMNWAHLQSSAFVGSTMILAVPIIASVAALFLLGEPLSKGQIGGGGAALLSVAAIVWIAAAARPQPRVATSKFQIPSDEPPPTDC